MFPLNDQQRSAFAEAVDSAAGRRDVRAAVHNVYAALQDALDLRKPVCDSSGRCCRFDAFGHRLFVTTMELATFTSDAGDAAHLAKEVEGGCPFQADKLCGVHAIRPFGCRIFFCDPTASDWQKVQYERFHGELQRLHDRLGVSYFYVEWREALSAWRGGKSALTRQLP